MSKQWHITFRIFLFVFVIGISAWQAANWYRTTSFIQEIATEYGQPSKAEHEKFQAELSATVMLQIPRIVDYLNALSADEQHAFIKQVKATLRDAALEPGETNLELLDKSMELFVNQLLEAGFEPRY